MGKIRARRDAVHEMTKERKKKDQNKPYVSYQTSYHRLYIVRVNGTCPSTDKGDIVSLVEFIRLEMLPGLFTQQKRHLMPRLCHVCADVLDGLVVPVHGECKNMNTQTPIGYYRHGRGTSQSHQPPQDNDKDGACLSHDSFFSSHTTTKKQKWCLYYVHKHNLCVYLQYADDMLRTCMYGCTGQERFVKTGQWSWQTMAPIKKVTMGGHRSWGENT